MPRTPDVTKGVGIRRYWGGRIWSSRTNPIMMFE
jgi:hypothetical protein